MQGAEQVAESVYLVVGVDAARKARAVERLRNSLVDPALAEWCVTSVDGADTTGADVLAMLSTPPFVGARRVVVVRAAHEMSGDEELVPYVESPAEFSALILVADAVDKRKKLYQAVYKRGKVIELEAPEAGQMPQVVARLAGEAGVSLDPAAAALLLERAGDDLNRLRSEIEKLALYAGEGGAISLEEAERVVARGHATLGQYAIFDFVDALAEGSGARALRLLDELLRYGEPPLLVLTMIARQFRLLFGALAWQGGPPAALAREMGLRTEFPAKKALAQARKWSAEAVTGALEACAECDASIKRGVDGRRALEALTVRLAYRV